MGSVLFVIGTIGCATADTMTELVIWRIFQAIGACVGPMLSRAMIRDRYSLAEAADKLSLITMLMAGAPIVGPSIGGLIVEFASWHMIFWAVAVVGVLIGIGTFFLPETLPEERRNKAGIKKAFKIYGELFADWAFMKYTLCVAFFYMGLMRLLPVHLMYILLIMAFRNVISAHYLHERSRCCYFQLVKPCTRCPLYHGHLTSSRYLRYNGSCIIAGFYDLYKCVGRLRCCFVRSFNLCNQWHHCSLRYCSCP